MGDTRDPGTSLDETDLEAPICATCGTQFPLGPPPDVCPICRDERQYVGADGQKWTTIREIGESGYANRIEEQEPGLIGIGTEPRFAIGQRALLVRTPEGNLLWDCISFVDDATVHAVQALGGVRAIAISHPHCYSAMASWSRALGDVPIYLHQWTKNWVVRPEARVTGWKGDSLTLFGGLSLYRIDGHFPGYQVLHWPKGSGGKGVLLSGDLPTVVQDRRWVSFMYSYPNLVPLSISAVQRIEEVLEPLAFDRLYGAWWPSIVREGAKETVMRSAGRYVSAIRGAYDVRGPEDTG